MALVTTVLEDGPRNYVVAVSGLAADTGSIDVSAISPDGNGVQPTRVSLMRVSYDVASGGSIDFNWNGSADVFYQLVEGQNTIDWYETGGIPNKTGGGNGDLEWAAPGADYAMTLWCKKKYA